MANEEMVKKENDSKKIFAMIIMIATLMICTTSATYAYFAIAPVSNNSITGTAATASLTLTVTKNAPTKTNTGVLVPQRETALASAMNTTNGCVDGNTNVICQVYTITVTNTSTATVKVNGTITFSGSTAMPNLKWRKTTNATTLGTGTTTAANVTTAQTLDSNKSLAKNAQATYYIVVWINAQMDANGNEVAQTDTGTYRATIQFTSSNGTGVTSTITS